MTSVVVKKKERERERMARCESQLIYLKAVQLSNVAFKTEKMKCSGTKRINNSLFFFLSLAFSSTALGRTVVLKDSSARCEPPGFTASHSGCSPALPTHCSFYRQPYRRIWMPLVSGCHCASEAEFSTLIRENHQPRTGGTEGRGSAEGL